MKMSKQYSTFFVLALLLLSSCSGFLNENSLSKDLAQNSLIQIESCNAEKATATPFAGGDGSPSSPFLICTAQQFNRIGDASNLSNLDKSYKLLQNIDLSVFSGTDFNIIGALGTSFTGTLDGNGKTLSNFSFSSGVDVALFASLSGTVKNLALSGVTLRGAGRVATIASECTNGVIERVTISSALIEQNDPMSSGMVGGFVGEGRNCEVSKSTVSGALNIDNGRAGGIIAYADGSSIFEAGSNLVISGVSIGTVGGLVGFSLNTTIRYSRALGQILGFNDSGTVAGGIAGMFMSANAALGQLMSNTYSDVDLNVANSSAYVGGLAGTFTQVGGGSIAVDFNSVVFYSGTDSNHGASLSAGDDSSAWSTEDVWYDSDFDGIDHAVNSTPYGFVETLVRGGAKVTVSGPATGTRANGVRQVSSLGFLNSLTSFGPSGQNWDQSIWKLSNGSLPKLFWEN